MDLTGMYEVMILYVGEPQTFAGWVLLDIFVWLLVMLSVFSVYLFLYTIWYTLIHNH